MIRSLLFVPADSDRFVAKAHERGADAIILDLEDGVTPDRKDMARERLADAALSVSRNGARVVVRVNPIPDRLDADIRAAHNAGAKALLLPKASIALMQRASRLLDELEGGAPSIGLIPVMEDAGAVLDARMIAAASPRTFALICGGEDLATDMRAEPTPQTLYVPKLLVHLASRAAGVLSYGLLRSIADYQDREGISLAAKDARSHGFDGATCVHPSVVPLLNEAFGPSAEELDRASQLVEAFEAARRESKGAFVFEGVMVDEPALKRAHLILGKTMLL